MKFQYLIENSSSEKVNEKMKKVKLDTENKSKKFFKDEVLNALKQIDGRIKK
jgi:hypothetical protein